MGLFDWLFGKSQPKPREESFSETPRIPSSGKEWKVGDRVLAKWLDTYFYPGRIRATSGKTCQVFFDDGDVAWVHKEHILQPDIRNGSQVFARLRGGPAYYPGTVGQQKGETILVRYDHGEEEWTTISLVRVVRPIANVGNEEPPPGFQPATPVKHHIDLGEATDGGNWREGDRVLARWLDFYWYPGTILGLGSKGFHVLFDDGDQRIVQENYLMPLVVEEGESLFIRKKNEPQRLYTPATVTQVDGETLDVELEDGQVETNTKISRARFWRCPVGMPGFHFEEGDRVLAFDMDDCLYPAEIVSIEEDRVIVHYLDGPERMLTPELIRRFDIRANQKLECRWKGGPNYFPGTIAKLEGERIYMEYDDGDKEWTTVRLVRIPKPMVR